MPREIYTPIFDGYFEGSIMLEAVETRYLFLFMLRLAGRPDAGGVVDLPLELLAAQARMPEDATRKALDALLRPDRRSGSKLKQGRRIIQLNAKQPDRGWRIVNFGRYIDAVHRAHDAARKRRERGGKNQNVRDRPRPSVNGATKTKTKTTLNIPPSPRSGGPSKKTPRLGELRKFDAAMVGASPTSYRKAFKQRFGVLPLARPK